MLDSVRIVLVSPSGPANVGAVCRAMANMGLSKLIVVSPRCDLNDEQAIAYATHGRPVLDAARVVDSIGAALEGCVASFATTAREGMYRRQNNLPPEEAARKALRRLRQAPSADVAILFGPENTGLTNTDLLEVDHIVSIPSDPAYPVLNLAAAVMVTCYEFRRAWLAMQADRGEVAAPGESACADDIGATESALDRSTALAPDERKVAMFRHLFDGLDCIGFFYGPNPDHLKYALRHMLGRLDLSINECDILTGMGRQISWYVRNRGSGEVRR